MIEIFLAPIILIVIALVATMIVITPQQHVRIIETFGKFAGFRNAGLSLKYPFPFQTASRPFSLQTRQFSDSVQVKSVDNVFVKIPVAVQFKVIPAQIRQAYYELEDPEDQMRSYIIAAIRSIASKMTFQHLYDEKDELSNEIKDAVGEKMHSYGYLIVDVLVDDPQPGEDIVRSYNDVVASVRAKEAATGYAEAERVRRVAEAKATGEAQEISAKATVEARRILAEGNAEAITKSIEGTGLGAEFGHHLVELSITAESIRDAARQGGRVVFVSGERGAPSAVHGLYAGLPAGGEPLKGGVPKVSHTGTGVSRKGETCTLDRDGDGVVDI